jgi:molybdopterin/thiamine biosynthesis adenylyltransferase
MNDQQLLRYARHILLEELGIAGQEKFLSAHVLIVGAGGLGSPASMYLASAGVGQITLVDDDVVALSNLQRQLLHTTTRLNESKVHSAQRTLHALNPEIVVHTINQRLSDSALAQAVARADVVVDCCDNFPTRYQINRACVQHQKPLVSGAALHFAGQVSVFDRRVPASPCYHCLFPEISADVLGPPDPADSCATRGIFAPLVGIVGSIQAAETLKLLAGLEQGLSGHLLCVEARTMQWRRMTIVRDEACTVCAAC